MNKIPKSLMKLKININGADITAKEGLTILAVAAQNGIYIPALCDYDQIAPFGACGVCVVEIKGSARLARACSTYITDNMEIKTDTERVIKTRELALSLMLSAHAGDCVAPCASACPAGTDCQGYVGLIANKQYREAAALIRGKLPLPSSIGRICPHPCEAACRRALVEEPISIAQLKYYVSDMYINDKGLIPKPAKETGKSAVIIGGGPGGLTAAYFLRSYGHAVTVYDAMPKMGGMLRYGIPEYRLPKSVLNKEIAAIEKMGVKYVNNIRIGRDISFETLRLKHNAALVAIGAWSSMKLRCPGEDLKGVYGGIDFLRDVSLCSPPAIGRTTAIVGGGNTAMDACRTAVRLGAEKVYVIYRRTRDEMPAEDIEIKEAIEEGVIFKYLTNPAEIIGQGEYVRSIKLQKMCLGEPDKSGRRSPVPIEGEFEIIEVESVIAAIGQAPTTTGFEGLNLTKWNTIIADGLNFKTNQNGVFAIGDATNNGAGIAIEAIGEAAKAAVCVNQFLINGFIVEQNAAYLSKTDPTPSDFADRERIPRAKMRHVYPDIRKANFKEINLGYSAKEAVGEAKRCLECGCIDYFECKLIKTANELNADPSKITGTKLKHKLNVDNADFIRNPDKCILCGLCVRVCDAVIQKGAIDFTGRGLNTVIDGFKDCETCISCGECVFVCPTGALTERITAYKPVPVAEAYVKSICQFCAAACRIKLTYKGDMLLRVLPDGGPLCRQGRFGFSSYLTLPRVDKPLIGDKEVSLGEACSHANNMIKNVISKYGAKSAAVIVSGALTNEALTLAAQYAASLGVKIYLSGIVYDIKDLPPLIRDMAGELPPYPNNQGAADLKIPPAGDLSEYKGLIMFGDMDLTGGNNVAALNGRPMAAPTTDMDLTGGDNVAALNGRPMAAPTTGMDLTGGNIIVAAAYINETVKNAGVLLPFTGFGEVKGTYTSKSGERLRINRAKKPLSGFTDTDVINCLLG